ncbi:hypothetical protein TIFTF001_023399 [Ficus carica]|uniref:Uncharacterized protein n=1 Tax=Ficus carica TaxID=3494 RepID=A0AA88ANF2_FICCA|nr:hypothetical protein TIFTF001_023399 [Ficus carica]
MFIPPKLVDNIVLNVGPNKSTRTHTSGMKLHPLIVITPLSSFWWWWWWWRMVGPEEVIGIGGRHRGGRVKKTLRSQILMELQLITAPHDVTLLHILNSIMDLMEARQASLAGEARWRAPGVVPVFDL